MGGRGSRPNLEVLGKSLKTVIKDFQNACNFNLQTFQTDWIKKKILNNFVNFLMDLLVSRFSGRFANNPNIS